MAHFDGWWQPFQVDSLLHRFLIQDIANKNCFNILSVVATSLAQSLKKKTVGYITFIDQVKGNADTIQRTRHFTPAHSHFYMKHDEHTHTYF